MKKNIYVSIDVEADGPIPGRNSMLAFGAAAFDLQADDPRKPVATFEANLDFLPEAAPDSGTMEWWAGQHDAWLACRKHPRPPEEAMPEFVDWIRKLPGRPVIVGYPVTYDFMFLYWYTMAFGVEQGQRSPFGYQGLDIKTLAWTKLPDLHYRQISKRRMPKSWFEGSPKHTHEALTDAIGQGVLFVNMMLEE